MSKKLQRYTFLAVIFLIPTQFAYHFWPVWSFVYGIRVDYLAPAIYITDLLVVSLILFNLNIYKKHWKQLLFIISLGLLNSFFSTAPIVSTFKWLKIIELILFAVLVIEQKIVKTDEIFKALFYSAIFFSLIGIAQFIKGGTTGLFYLLGERSFNVSTPGIALVSIVGRSFLRAYSTFPHPNALAGFLGIVIILSAQSLRKIRLFAPGIIVIGICFLITFSLSAFIGIGVALLLSVLRSKKVIGRTVYLILGCSVLISLFLPMISSQILSAYPNFSQNISQRLDLAFVAGNMIADKFLVGEGLNTFIINTPRFKGIFSYSWLLQPVHNIFLLVLTETGIVGLLSFCFLLLKLIAKNLRDNTTILIVFIFIVFTGLADHYWLTLQQNLLILSVFVGLSFRRLS